MSQYLKPNPEAWTKIEHIVVLMLENRSFDNMLGWLDDGSDATWPPRGQHFEGLNPTLCNPLHVTDSNGKPFVEDVYVRKNGEAPKHGARGPVRSTKYAVEYNLPQADPGEGYKDTNYQLFQVYNVDDLYPPEPTMRGFVQNYQDAMLFSTSTFGDPPTNPRSILACYTPEQTKVLSTLAREFCVCDHWHCSVPSQTWPNRAFAFAASSGGNENNKPSWVVSGDTIFDRMQDAIEGGAGVQANAKLKDWAVYGGTQRGEFFSLTQIMLDNAKQARFKANFKPITEFYAAAAAGELPSFSLLEPQFSGEDQNDQKPPSDVRPGEALIAEVYEKLKASKNWKSTLLIVTYDEHGGCYDHVAPPNATAPPEGDHEGRPGNSFGFRFNRFGVRVPAVVISPWIERGTVGRPAGYVPFDHTSIIASTLNCFDVRAPNGKIAHLNARDAAAPDLSCLLNRYEGGNGSPRSDKPAVSAPDLSGVPRIGHETGLLRDIVSLIKARTGMEPAPQESIHDFLVRFGAQQPQSSK